MMQHKSVFHVSQPIGSFFSKDRVSGYYNDLTNKVISSHLFDEEGIPINKAANKNQKRIIHFPITIFQYGLGCYDYYLKTSNSLYKNKMISTADWAIKNLRDNGSWNSFGCLYYSCAVSSMAQGEGVSLLARAYNETNNKIYLESAIKATNFMLQDIDNGGTAQQKDDILVLYEYPNKNVVLNGWIFSAFGLYDIWKLTNENKYGSAWHGAVKGIKEYLPKFDSGIWSYYSLDGKYASPFYHKLHIELLKALNQLSPDEIFNLYISNWSKFQNSFWNSKIAFLCKAKQKLLERNSKEWVMVE